jgi:hypothetical protein
MRAKVQQSEMSWPAEWCQHYPAGQTDLASSVEPGARKVRETCSGIANVSGRNPPHCSPSTPARPRGIASPLTGPKRTPDREYPWQTLEGTGTLDAFSEDRAIHAWTGQGRSPGEDW